MDSRRRVAITYVLALALLVAGVILQFDVHADAVFELVGQVVFFVGVAFALWATYWLRKLRGRNRA
jgi:hypothetical protein